MNRLAILSCAAAAGAIGLGVIGCTYTAEEWRCGEASGSREVWDVNPARLIQPGASPVVPPITIPGHPGQVYQYPDGQRTFRPDGMPGHEYPVNPRLPSNPLPKAASADAFACPTRMYSEIDLTYDAATGWTEFEIATAEVPAEARHIPQEHCLITDQADGATVIAADQTAIGTLMYMRGTDQVVTPWVHVRMEKAPLWQGNVFRGYIMLARTELVTGETSSRLVVTSW